MPGGDDYLEDDPPIELDPVTGEPIPPESGPSSPSTSWVPTKVGGSDSGVSGDEDAEEEYEFGPEDPGPETSRMSRKAKRVVAGGIAAAVVAGALGIASLTGSGDSPEPAPSEEDSSLDTTAVESDEAAIEEALESPPSAQPAAQEPESEILSTCAELVVDAPETDLKENLESGGTSWPRYFEVLAGNVVGHRPEREFTRTLYLVMECDEVVKSGSGFLLRYRIAGGLVTLEAVASSNPSGSCTYTAPYQAVDVDESNFLITDKVGYLEFDLSAEPLTYRVYLSTNNVDHMVTQSCVDGAAANTANYGVSITWADQQKHEPVAGDFFEWGGLDLGPEEGGFVDVSWDIIGCIPGTGLCVMEEAAWDVADAIRLTEQNS